MNINIAYNNFWDILEKEHLCLGDFRVKFMFMFCFNTDLTQSNSKIKSESPRFCQLKLQMIFFKVRVWEFSWWVDQLVSTTFLFSFSKLICKISFTLFLPRKKHICTNTSYSYINENKTIISRSGKVLNVKIFLSIPALNCSRICSRQIKEFQRIV